MKFYALFVDDHSRSTWLYPLRKSDFFEVFVKFQKCLKNSLLNALRYSKVMEVVNSLAQSSLTTWKIVVLLGISCPTIPEQNGIAIAERKHRHVVEPGLTLLFHAKLPLFTWSETFLTVVFLINRLPSIVLKNTPFHKIHGTHLTTIV